MIWDTWEARWLQTLQACEQLGGEVRPLVIGPPATEQEVQVVEEVLGLSLPTSLRQVLTEFAASVSFWWQLPYEMALPDSLREIFGGECHWALPHLIVNETSRRSWMRQCFPNVEDEYDRVWHNKLGIMEVANGDIIALDLALPSAPVVYLSHDGGEGHGYRLGGNFADYINRATMLGCPGNEDWQMIPFLPSPTSGIDPLCPNAVLWRKIFGLPTSIINS